ncbi:hypothetical protein OC845_001385 [Tilletia horrida]|nr:hypothetical protein OC845_001385 [Tilletia horrida]
MSAVPKYISQLQNTKVLIIGGSSGIGLSVAAALIEEGASVVIASSRQAKVDEAIVKLNDPKLQYNADPSRVVGYTVDLQGPGAEESLRKFFDQVGTIDHLIYTAADPLPIKPLKEQTYESIVSTGNIRLFSTILAVKTAVYGGYLKEGGSIILTSGCAWQYPYADWTVICAYAGALVSLAKALALDLSSKSIRCNVIAPGPILTDVWKGVPDEAVKAMAASALTGKLGLPEWVAQSYVYALKSPNVNGECIGDDGGAYAPKRTGKD